MRFYVHLITLLFLFTAGLTSKAGAEISKDMSQSHAVVLVYKKIDEDSYNDDSMRLDLFEKHIRTLVEENYNVLPLSYIINRLKADKPLPSKAVAITFDGGFRSVYQKAVPLLERFGLPYTLFFPTNLIDRRISHRLSWDEIRSLQKTGLAGFGITGADNTPLVSGQDTTEIKAELNRARSRFREILGVDPAFLSYPHGIFSKDSARTVEQSGFEAAFSNYPGVLYAGSNFYTLPRFLMNDSNAKITRFQGLLDALPLKVSDVHPEDPFTNGTNTVFGFTLNEVSVTNENSLMCRDSGGQVLNTGIIGQKRVEIRFRQNIMHEKGYVQCLMADDSESPENKRKPLQWVAIPYFTRKSDTALQE